MLAPQATLGLGRAAGISLQSSFDPVVAATHGLMEGMIAAVGSLREVILLSREGSLREVIRLIPVWKGGIWLNPMWLCVWGGITSRVAWLVHAEAQALVGIHSFHCHS